MEEILASIRRIIADDGEVAKERPEGANDTREPPPADPDDVLDLAHVPGAQIARAPAADPEMEIPDLSFVETLSKEPSPVPVAPPLVRAIAPDAAPAGGAAPPAEAAVPHPPEARAGRPEIAAAAPPPAIDQLVSTATTASVANAFNILSHTILTQNARTLEDLVREMLKPMLKVWLDDNLPPLVERLVRAEIERVARGSR